MSTDQNKAVVRRLLEAGLNLDAALLDELFAPDYVSGMAPGGREGSKQMLTMMKSAYPASLYIPRRIEMSKAGMFLRTLLQESPGISGSEPRRQTAS